MTEQTFILPAGKAALLGCLERLEPSKKWRVTVKEYRKERSDQQNRALFGVAYKTIRDATGNDVDDLHTLFCGEFFGWKEVEIMGQRKRKPMRTTTTDENGQRSVITTAEFSDFYTAVQMKAAEFGIDVPNPGEPHA